MIHAANVDTKKSASKIRQRLSPHFRPFSPYFRPFGLFFSPLFLHFCLFSGDRASVVRC